ncbi:MAG: hypothetical protein ACI4XQ_05580 [Eubacteriales bacterium]
MELADGKLEKILNSPETMAKIAEIARGLGSRSGEGDEPRTESETAEAFARNPPLPGAEEETGMSRELASVLGKAMEGFRGDERRIGMLKALKPLSDGKSAGTVDRAILAIRIAKAVKCILPEVGIL